MHSLPRVYLRCQPGERRKRVYIHWKSFFARSTSIELGDLISESFAVIANSPRIPDDTVTSASMEERMSCRPRPSRTYLGFSQDQQSRRVSEVGVGIEIKGKSTTYFPEIKQGAVCESLAAEISAPNDHL